MINCLLLCRLHAGYIIQFKAAELIIFNMRNERRRMCLYLILNLIFYTRSYFSILHPLYTAVAQSSSLTLPMKQLLSSSTSYAASFWLRVVAK